MKNCITALLLISFSILSAQQISDYKYIIIPKKFQEFDENQYKLNTYLKNLLIKKGYEILTEEKTTWPAEALSNPCMAVTADVKKRKNLMKNKAEIEFTTCNGTHLTLYTGVSSESRTEKGYQDAMKIATQSIANSNPKENIAQTKKIEKEFLPQGNISENSLIQNGLEFKNENITVILTELKDGTYALIQKDNSNIIAYLKQSSRSGIYHVKIFYEKGSYDTIGFYDMNTLAIEFMTEDESWKPTEFTKN